MKKAKSDWQSELQLNELSNDSHTLTVHTMSHGFNYVFKTRLEKGVHVKYTITSM